MKLTIRTWVTFFLLALVMGLNNIYSTLLTGWGDGGSIVAVILCLLFLAKHQRNITNYNLGQTMASAGGGVGFIAAMVASIYVSYARKGIFWEPPLFKLSLLVMALSVMGVAIAVPLRRFVIRWFFPSGVACATILRAVTSENAQERERVRKIMGISGFISALLTLPTKVAWKEGGAALWSKIAFPGGVALSLDPLLYGIGIVIGLRIGMSMLIGGLFYAFILTPQLTAVGENVEEYTRWIAVGLMTLPAFSSMFFSLLFKKKQVLPPGFTPKESDEEDQLSGSQWLLIFLVFLGALSLAIVIMKSIFDVDWGYVVAGAGIAGPLCFALGKVASETDINPVRLLAIILLFLFSLFGMNNPAALLATGIGGAALAAIAVDLFIDLRTGYLIRANPKQQIIMQFLGVIPVSFVGIFFLHTLAVQFGFGEGKFFPAPGAVVWATMAEAFSKGATAISANVWIAAGIASCFGIVLSLFENWKRTSQYAPSSFALGIALIVPIEMSFAIFLGAVLRTITIFLAQRWGEAVEHQAEEEAFHIGSAIFAASALAGIVAVLLISFGILHLPS